MSLVFYTCMQKLCCGAKGLMFCISCSLLSNSVCKQKNSSEIVHLYYAHLILGLWLKAEALKSHDWIK